jgi:hypothetical protein
MLDMKCAAVCVGIDGHRRDAELATRTNETQRDLAAIGNEDLAKGSHR